MLSTEFREYQTELCHNVIFSFQENSLWESVNVLIRYWRADVMSGLAWMMPSTVMGQGQQATHRVASGCGGAPSNEVVTSIGSVGCHEQSRTISRW